MNLTATVYGSEFQCSRVEKGTDYVKLFDASGAEVASFSGISDFAGYSITGGEFQAPQLTETEKINQQLAQINQDMLDLMNALFPEE